MKKLFAVALAVAMLFSLAAVSFAATAGSNAPEFEFVGIGDEPFHYDAVGYYDSLFSDPQYAPLQGLAMFGDGDHLMMRNGYISYGAAAYYPIIFADVNGYEFVAADSDLIEGLKFKTEFEQGANLVKDVSIVKMNVRSVVDTVFPVNQQAGLDETTRLAAALNNGVNYIYFLKISVNPYITTGEDDIIGTVTFDCKDDEELDIVVEGTKYEDSKVLEVEDLKCPINFPVHVERHYTAPNVGTIVDDEFEVEYEKLYSLKFDNDEEVELTFGGGAGSEQNEGRFTVDVSGQGKVILNVTTTANEAIVAANPGVEMYFVNFNGVKFNRAGEFEYEMEDLAAAYMVVNNQLVPIPGLEIEDDTATFTTNMLVPYVFATAELVNPAPVA
ncbi:MAG: hypothetical protein II995_02775 [Oscillospiraceae bacterium]|nr:hypothetical protein [Oscillospiraceae bacterium]